MRTEDETGSDSDNNSDNDNKTFYSRTLYIGATPHKITKRLQLLLADCNGFIRRCNMLYVA